MDYAVDEGRHRRRLVVTILAVAVVLAAAAVAVFLVVQDSDSTTERQLKANLVTGFIIIEGSKVTAAGTYTGSPGGNGAAVVTLFPQGDLRQGKPVALKGNVKFYLDGGLITSTLKGTATPLPKNTFAVKGTGTIVAGTGAFDGATGSFKFDGGQEAGEIVGRPKINGTIEY